MIYFVDFFQGRSKSLTSIDTIGPTMPNGGTSASDLGGLDCGGRLSVPMRPERSDHSTPSSPGYHRRRKLSTASKVSLRNSRVILSEKNRQYIVICDIIGRVLGEFGQRVPCSNMLNIYLKAVQSDETILVQQTLFASDT